MDMSKICKLCETGKIEWTLHVAKRLLQRGITSNDVTGAIIAGEIIENYPEDYPFPSCLIMGKTDKNRVLHIVGAVGDDKLWMITAYEPNVAEWDAKFKTRKEQT